MNFPSAGKYKNLPEMEGCDDFDYTATLAELSGTDGSVRKRLLGLREVRKWTEAEVMETLGNARRYSVFQNISTNTLPVAERIRQKRAVVLDFIEGGFVSESVLRDRQTVYIGSGTDVEYPLALGARRITLLDPIFSEKQARNTVIEKLRRISGGAATAEADQDGSTIVSFTFPFEESIDETEIVTVHLVAARYQGQAAELSENTGLVMLFAAQDAIGRVELPAEAIDQLVEGGAVLQEDTLALTNGRTVTLSRI